jgi:hypothetical protein
VVADYTSGGFNAQAFPPSPATPQTTYATPNSHEVGTAALSTYDGGVLAADDDLTNTYVEYAASGSDFNSSSSYKSVANFANEDTVALSGNALLTDPRGSLTGGDVLRVLQRHLVQQGVQPLKNQLVTLERLKGKRWYTVRTTHEPATGKFSFTVPGVTRTYRAVVADKPGYYEYGYSSSVTLKA